MTAFCLSTQFCLHMQSRCAQIPGLRPDMHSLRDFAVVERHGVTAHLELSSTAKLPRTCGIDFK